MLGPRLLAASLLLLAACPRPSYPRPADLPDAAGFIAQIERAQTAARTFKLESRMDYRVGDERVKSTVLVMGKTGARLRFNALDPSGVVAADLACDGFSYVFVDFQKNCQRTGPCTGDAIASLLRVDLEPDDFFYLAIGTTAVLRDTTGAVRWDESSGIAEVSLLTRDRALTQSLRLDGREGHFDVLESTVKNAAGEVKWRIENKDFRAVERADGTAGRLPERTRFEQPDTGGDLRIRWEKQALDVELPDGAWTLSPPAGLPVCR